MENQSLDSHASMCQVLHPKQRLLRTRKSKNSNIQLRRMRQEEAYCRWRACDYQTVDHESSTQGGVEMLRVPISFMSESGLREPTRTTYPRDSTQCFTDTIKRDSVFSISSGNCSTERLVGRQPRIPVGLPPVRHFVVSKSALGMLPQLRPHL